MTGRLSLPALQETERVQGAVSGGALRLKTRSGSDAG
jgi:hypothetical protein